MKNIFYNLKFIYFQVKSTSHKRKVNLSSYAWRELTRHVGRINAAVESKEPSRFVLWDMRFNSLQVKVEWFESEALKVKQQAFIGFHFYNSENVRLQGKGMNLTLKEWSTLKEKMVEIEQAVWGQETNKVNIIFKILKMLLNKSLK